MRKALPILAAAWVWCAGPGASAAPAPAPEVIFEGNTIFNNARLLRALARYDVRIADDVTTADDGAFFLREFYFDEGFPDADVRYQFSPARVVFEIEEGPRLWLGRVVFEGGDTLDRDRIQAVFEASLRQSTHTPFGRLRFVANAVEDAAGRVRATYVSEGFLDAWVAFETAEGLRKDSMDVVVRIDEGVRFFLRELRLNADVPEEVRAGLEAGLQPFFGRAYRPGDELLARSRVFDHLRSVGYYFAEVRTRVDRSGSGEATLFVDVDAGRQMVFGNVRVEGAARTLRSAILRKFGIRAGRTYNAAAVTEAERRLWFTGAFSDIQVTTEAREDGSVDMILNLEEGRARHVSGTVGYSQWDQAFGSAVFTDRNFLGTLNRFSLEGFISQRSYGGAATLEDPWFFRQNLTGRIQAFGARRELPAYRAAVFGAVAGLSARANDTTLTGWGLDYEWRVVTDTDVYSDENGSLENYRLGIVSFRQQYDTRNDLLSPTRGYNLRYDVGIASPAMLSELTFFRASAQATWYVPLLRVLPERPFVPFFVFNHRAGLIVPFGSTSDIPVPERFFLGGPDSVRSFQLDGMAPRDNAGNPTGGLAYLQANVELQWPIWRGTFVAAFTDFGNLTPEWDEFAWDQTRVAPGAGLRLYTPLGAVRLDYGFNLIRQDGDPIGNWQFGLGFTF